MVEAHPRQKEAPRRARRAPVQPALFDAAAPVVLRSRATPPLRIFFPEIRALRGRVLLGRPPHRASGRIGPPTPPIDPQQSFLRAGPPRRAQLSLWRCSGSAPARRSAAASRAARAGWPRLPRARRVRGGGAVRPGAVHADGLHGLVGRPRPLGDEQRGLRVALWAATWGGGLAGSATGGRSGDGYV